MNIKFLIILYKIFYFFNFYNYKKMKLIQYNIPLPFIYNVSYTNYMKLLFI